METAGLSNGRVDSIIGHADRVLLVPSHPLHASNRRISVLVRRQHQG
jgi:flagellar motor protein MotB